MTSWSRKLVLVLALAVMPLQGVAAAMSALLCHGDAQVHAAHESGGHDHGVQHDSHHDGGDTTGDDANNPCCHISVSVPSAVTLATALPDFPIRAFVPDSLHDLFVPDQPQRPPLA